MRLTLLFAWFGLGLAMFSATTSPFDPIGVDGPRMSEPWWPERYREKQVELHKQPVRLVFLGDSIFHSFEWDPRAPDWNHWYGGRGAVNLGFNGDTTADVIWRVHHGELEGLSLRLVVILIGTNDFNLPPAEIAGAIENLAQSVRDRSPESKILILGILPSGRPKAEQQIGGEVNARLSAFYAQRGAIASYQDLSCVFLRHGQLNSQLFREPDVPDHSYPLHPTPRGMDLLAAAIEPTVAAMLGDQRRTTSSPLEDTDCPTDR